MKKTITKKNTSSLKKTNATQTGDDTIISVLQTLPVGVIVYTLKNILFANKAAFNLLKFDKKLEKKIDQLSVFDFLHADYHKTVRGNAKKLFSGQKVTPQLYQLSNPKGEVFYIESKSNFINFKGKKAIQAVFSDVTNRVKTEAELLDKESTFKLLTQNSSDIIFLYNYYPKEHYSYVSDSVKDILGYKPADFYKDSSFIQKIVLHPTDRKNNGKNYPKKVIQEFKRKDGSVVCLETRYSLLKSHSGNVMTLVGISRDVSNEKDAVAQLKASEEKFKIITQNVNDLIYFFTYQPKPKYLYVNPSVKNVLGYSDKDFYNNPDLCNSIVVNKKEYKAIELRLAKEQKAGTLKRSTQVFEYISKSGKSIWLKDEYTPIFDESGKINYILGVSRDITAEKRAQFELEQKWNDYKNLIENSPIGIFIHENGQCLYCNKTAAHFLEEKNPAKIVGKNLISFIVPEQRERGIQRIKQASQGVELTDLTYKIITTKKNIIEVDLKTVPILFNGKQCVQTIVYNLSAEKKLAKEILRAEVAEDLNKQLIEEIKFRKKIQKELVSQSSKYEAIFNNTSHMVGTINRDFIITSFNKNYFKYLKNIFQYEVKIGDHLSSIKALPAQSFNYQLWEEKLNNVFNATQNHSTDFFEIKNYDVDGNAYYREIYLHPLKDSNGVVEEIAIIGHDVTERKRSEQKILEQAAKLSAIFDSGEQLIWTVNKEFRLTSFNTNFSEAMYELYGIYPASDGSRAFNPLKGGPQEHLYRWWISKYQEVFDSKTGIKFTIEQVDKNNKKHFRQVFISPIINNSRVTELSCISYDITELKYLQSESVKLEQKLRSIFESSSHLIWTINKGFDITSFNQNFSDTFESKYHVKPVLYCRPGDLLTGEKKEEYENFWHDIYTKSFAGEKLKFERKETDDDGKTLYREVFVNPIKNQNGEIIELACLAHDITENKNFESQILNQSAKLKAIFESSSHLIWTVNKNFELTSYNSNYFNLVKDNIIRNNALEKPVIFIKDTIKNPERLKFWLDKYSQVLLTGKHDLFIHKSISSDHKEVYREIYLYPIYLDAQVSEVSVIAKDITERIHNEEQILKQSAKLKAIFESGTQLMWTIDKGLKLTSFNQNYANAIHGLYGFYPEVSKGIRELSNNQTKPFEAFWDEKYNMAFQGFPVEFTSERVLLNGSKVYRQYFLYPITNSEGIVEEVSGIGFDITENKLNEVKIIQSLKEKEVLLKEVHHRVKNNMQVISSILNLQSSYVKDAYALNLLKECQNRIKTMAFIHESLYQTKNFESVNFSEYVTTLTKNLIHSYTINSQKIKLILTLDNLFLNLDTSIPCGLIINEIVSNSLKYAFPDNRDGIIFVNLKKDKHKVTIEAGDNGVGFPETLDIKKTQTLGLQLVDTLIEQIGGSLTIDNSKGTKFIIEFKI